MQVIILSQFVRSDANSKEAKMALYALNPGLVDNHNLKVIEHLDDNFEARLIQTLQFSDT